MMPSSETIRFTARVVAGSGRGKRLKIPTLNLDPSGVPGVLTPGIYACWAGLGERKLMGALHYGPRPVFCDNPSLEVHILDEVIDLPPPIVAVQVVKRIRDVQDFPSVEALLSAIRHDIAQVRAILSGA